MNGPRQLAGRTALVTGSTHGIGAAIAEALADSGARVIIHGLHNDEHARNVCSALDQRGALAGLVTGDLSGPMPECVERLAEQATDLAGDIDLLVNNAGTYIDTPYLEMAYDVFDRTMKLNVYAGFLLTQWFARRWTEQGTEGRVLFVGSINGKLAEPDHAAYDTSKGAVEMMVRTLCVSLAPQGIRVNGVAPGLFDTPLTAGALADPKLRKWMEWHTPNRHIPGPDACAAAAVFLLSDAADHIHGHMLMVDGGMSAWQQPDPP